jgi:hypothetical protein
MFRRLIIFLFGVLILTDCTNGQKEIKKACVNVNVIRDGKLVAVDSCFTAYSQDSLDLILKGISDRSSALQDEFDTWMIFVFADTLNKKPEEYQYGLVISKAGVLDPNVILTTDEKLVKQRCSAYKNGNITLKKIKTGESMKVLIEDFFKHNIRINYHWEGNLQVDS